MPEDSNEFYWDNLFVKVEDKLFCVPRCEFVQSSEVFADMFLLPSGPSTPSEGQDRDHPIVLEGYKKDEFACLLKVMYPTATSVISGKNFELHLKKEEWVSVLKLSTIWNMNKIRQYAIHRLSTDQMLPESPIERILLARAYGVGAWLDEAIISLVTCNPMPALEDLATLGWETVARILWIRDNFPLNTLRFKQKAIKCVNCSWSSTVMAPRVYRGCGHITSEDAELTFPASGSASLIPGTIDFSVELRQIECLICRVAPFRSGLISCKSCLHVYDSLDIVRVSLYTMINEIFGKEIQNLDSEP